MRLRKAPKQRKTPGVCFLLSFKYPLIVSGPPRPFKILENENSKRFTSGQVHYENILKNTSKRVGEPTLFQITKAFKYPHIYLKQWYNFFRVQ